jgi:membrane-associated phospholipid phosphatase
MNKVSQAISIIFHPLLLTTYLVLLLGFSFPPMLLIPKNKLWVFSGLIFCVTFVLPVLNLLIFKQFKIISSLTMHDRKDRTTPFFFISIVYVMAAVLFYYRIHLSLNFSKVMMITASLVVITCAITFFYKISVHSLSIWGAIGIILPLCKLAGLPLVYATASFIVIAGLVMAARLQLDAHTPRQVLVGALVGFAVGFGGMIALF